MQIVKQTTKTDWKRELRSRIFRHLDGIATIPCLYSLYKKGLLEDIRNNRTVNLNDLTSRYNANEGYLNVALRVLSSQGWLEQRISKDEKDVEFKITERGKTAFSYPAVVGEVVEFIPNSIQLEKFIKFGFESGTFHKLVSLFDKHRSKWNFDDAVGEDEEFVQQQVYLHIEGLIAGPLIVALGMNGMFHNYFSIAPFKIEEYSTYHEEMRELLRFFKFIGWLTEEDGIFNFTEEGLFFAKRASAYGVTVSYLPMFSKMDELIFGNPNVLWDKPVNSPEIHVNRKMNVWGSGGAHTGYFKIIDKIIIEIFNQPLEKQPKGFLDMGCGNGAFIEHIFNVVWNNTLRGENLGEYPLFIVGADFNNAALEATRETLNSADIWAKVIFGDISDPDILAAELQKKYHIDLQDLLNVRSFLDHNRIYSPPGDTNAGAYSGSTAAFAFRGKRIPNTVIEQNLKEHLQKWAPYVKKFGLLLIELHTVAPELAAGNIGKTAVTAYDATHGFSDQYILELPLFLKVAEKAGLKADRRYQARFPESELASISINLFKE